MSYRNELYAEKVQVRPIWIMFDTLGKDIPTIQQHDQHKNEI